MMKFLIVIFVLAFCAFHVTAQVSSVIEPQIISTPRVKAPPEARKSGLGGRISVLVWVGDNGSVISIDEVNGPDWVCQSVTRADVIALRKVASEAALKARFKPAIFNGKPNVSKTSLNIDFPKDSKKNNGPVIGHRIPEDVLKDKVQPKPNYPAAALAAGVSGSVSVKLLIDEEGKVFSAEPVNGHALLQEAARIAACQAKFTPTRLSGKPVKVADTIQYNFMPKK